jgi:hypothetical protein
LASKVRWTGNIIIGDIILQLLFSFWNNSGRKFLCSNFWHSHKQIFS